MLSVRRTTWKEALSSCDLGFIKRWAFEPKLSYSLGGKVLLTMFLLDQTVSFCKLSQLSSREKIFTVLTIRKLLKRMGVGARAFTASSDSQTQKLLGFLGFQLEAQKTGYHLFRWQQRQ